MRLIVATYGSEGDTRPFVALCRGLGDAGHDVKLFAEQSSVHIAHAHGIDSRIERTDFRAKLLLRDDATLEPINIERGNASSRRNQRVGQRTEKHDALFKQIQVACGIRAH